MQSTTNSVLIITNLIFIALAVFLAIMLWIRSHEVAWMLMIVATFSSYVYILFDILVKINIIYEEELSILGLPIVRLILSNLAPIFMSLAFITVIRKKKI